MKIKRIDITNSFIANDVLNLHYICFDGQSKPQLDNWWWGVYDESDLIGFCSLYPSIQWRNAVYLYRVGVHPHYRGKGLQRRLINVRLKFARKMGYDYAVTDTRQNPSSANNLIRCGFLMYKPSNPWSFNDACYWYKNLRN